MGQRVPWDAGLAAPRGGRRGRGKGEGGPGEGCGGDGFGDYKAPGGRGDTHPQVALREERHRARNGRLFRGDPTRACLNVDPRWLWTQNHSEGAVRAPASEYPWESLTLKHCKLNVESFIKTFEIENGQTTLSPPRCPHLYTGGLLKETSWVYVWETHVRS